MKRAFCVLLLWLFSVAPASATQQRPVEVITPRGGCRGTTVEVLLQGMDIADPREIVFYRSGIEAVDFEPATPLKHPFSIMHDGRVVEQVKVRFRIAADCPVGEHPFRLRTATSLSTLCTFWVSRFPSVEEQEKEPGANDTLDHAEPIALNSTVAGKIANCPKLDVDLYRVEMKAGQRLAVEVESLRLNMMAYGYAEYDLTARVLDSAGHELARNDDNAQHIQDPLLSLIVPRDGAYFVEIRQQLYLPHHWGYYRVHIGSFLRPTAVFPAGGRVGERLSVRLLGDAAGDTTQTVTLPEKSGGFDWFPGAADEQPPSPLAVRVSPYPNVLETASSDDPNKAASVAELPAALNGIIAAPGESDYFRLRVHKGETWRIRVFARSLGTPLDAKIWLRPAAGSPEDVELDADDSRLQDRDVFALSGSMMIKDQLDPSIVFTPKQDGDYLLGIADTRSLGGPSYIYRIEVEPVRDAIYPYVVSTAHDAFEVNRVTGFIVPQGNRWTLNVLFGAGLGNRYQGPFELEAVGLPAGVRMEAPPAGAGAKSIPVQFIADPSAREQTALIQLLARPVDKNVELVTASQQAIPLTNRSGGHAWHYVALDRFALAVTQPAPFHIELEQPRIALAQSGELTLTVKLIRHANFQEAVDIQPDWLPPGVAGQSAVTINPGETEAKFTLHADAGAKPGEYRVAMNATTTGGLFYSGVGRTRVSSEFIKLRINEPYLAVIVPRAAIERGKRGQIVCEIKQLKPFPGEATAALRRLPGGVRLLEPLPRITSNDRKVTFQIEATPDALVGQYAGVFCEVTVEENGQSIHQQTGSGVLRVDPARGVTRANP